MKYAFTLAAVLIIGCNKEDVLPAVDTREPISMSYVTGPELKVHSRHDENSPVIATYQNSESVAVLAKEGDWVEIRTGAHAGWAKGADLGSASEAKRQEDNPSPRFLKKPNTITQVGVHGEIYLEADVNTDGDVVSARIIGNTTGNDALAAQNMAALKEARFYPIVQNGTRKPFKYYHRVTY